MDSWETKTVRNGNDLVCARRKKADKSKKGVGRSIASSGIMYANVPTPSAKSKSVLCELVEAISQNPGNRPFGRGVDDGGYHWSMDSHR